MLVISLICWAYLACSIPSPKGIDYFCRFRITEFFVYVHMFVIWFTVEMNTSSKVIFTSANSLKVLCYVKLNTRMYIIYGFVKTRFQSGHRYIYIKMDCFFQISIRIRPQRQLYTCIISAKFGPNCNCFFLNNY